MVRNAPLGIMSTPEKRPDAPSLASRLEALDGIAKLRRSLSGSRVYLVGGAVRDLLRGATRADLDLVVEGDAVRDRDETTLQRFAAAYEAKYGSDWRFTVRDGAFRGAEGNEALVFAVTPTTAFGFGKGEPFSQTRWRF